MAEAGSEADVQSDAAPTLKPKIVEKVGSIPCHSHKFAASLFLPFIFTCIFRP
jgi:hypothetical protein